MKNILAEGQRIANLGTFEYVVDTRTTVWSEEEYRIYGLDPAGPSPAYDVMLAKSIHPDDAALLHQTFGAAMQSGSIYELEHRIVRPDGSVRWVYDRAHPHFDQNGKLVRYIGATLDITDRKRAEETMRTANEELELRVRERTEELTRSQNRLQNLSSQLLLAQEKERKRVAAELHDGLLSELAATKYLLEGKVMQLDQGKSVNADELRRVSVILATTMKEARRIMTNLHPSVLDELGFIAAMKWVCAEYQKSYPHISVQTEIGGSEEDISDGIRVVIFRVLQEALNNFAKHGKGNRVEISLSKTGGIFSFMVRDDGQGFDMEKTQMGLGIESMRERVELSGGEFQIESIIGQGTFVRAIWSI
jgi:PAS domain S-box-containing protein